MKISVCFIGHRKIHIDGDLIGNIKNKINELVDKYSEINFLFGSQSEFDGLCYSIVTEIKKEKSNINRIAYTCKSEEAISETNRERYEEALSKLLGKRVNLRAYEAEVEHKSKYVAGKASYVERNMAMIDDSDVCIVYYNHEYLPPKRKVSKSSSVEYQPKSGTAIAVEYARKKKKEIINFYDL